MAIFVDVLGWVGTVLYLVAYALVSVKKVEGDSFLYHSYVVFRKRYQLISQAGNLNQQEVTYSLYQQN